MAALQNALDNTIKALDAFPDSKAKFDSLLMETGEKIQSDKTPKTLEDDYQSELTERYPFPEGMSERTRTILGTVFRVAQLTQGLLPTPQKETPGIQSAARAAQREIDAFRKAAAQRPAETESPAIEALRKDVSDSVPAVSASLAGFAAESPLPGSEFETVRDVIADLRTALALQGPVHVCYDLPRLSQELANIVRDARPALQAYQAVSSETLQDFGNKEANLVRQRRLLEALQIKDIEVPRSEGFRTGQVQDYLKRQAPEIFTHWEDLQKAYAAHSGSEAFLKTPRALKLLAQIDAALEKAFSNPQAFKGLNATPEMQSWLAHLSAQGGYLMVRSTGSEDSKENANAGGNLSEAYVSADPQSVAKSVGNVVRSYFGTGSLQNRINAGRNPFSEELKLSVTLQELIGEPLGGSENLQAIPRSLVMFTNEPLFVGDEEFRVMRLSATYGHGEGVVGNQGIASDTILVLNSLVRPDQLVILYDNQDKATRLAPVRGEDDKISLKPIENTKTLRRARVFSEKEVARLFQWGLIGEAYFGEPTDMEIVVRGDKIYPVQARPVNRQPLLPSYVDLSKAREELPVMRAEAFVPGRGSVINIDNKNQVLIASTLEEAERAFDKSKHKLVVVSQKEPANSHPVVNFSSMGMTCLAVPADRQEQLNHWLDALSERVLLVCPQSGSVYSVPQAKVASLISNGFVQHPAKTARSFDLEEPLLVTLNQSQDVPKDLEDLLMNVNTALTPERALEQLQKVRQNDWVQSLIRNREHLEERLKYLRVKPKEALKIIEVAKKFEAQIKQTFEEARLALEASGRLRALFQIKDLGTLLFERQSEGVNQFSVASIKLALQAGEEIASYQEQLGEQEARFTDILLEGQRSPNPDIYPVWREFLLKLEKLPPAQTETFREMMTDLNQANELALWMTIHFQEGNELSDPIQALKKFEEQFPPADKTRVQEIIKQLNEIRQLRSQLADFQDPEKFEQRFAALQAQAKVLSADHLVSLQGGAALNALRLKVMNELVDLYDVSIKSMKQGRYTDADKAERFKRMITPYTDLMVDWAQNLMDVSSFGWSNGMLLEDYLAWSKNNLIGKLAMPTDLAPSQDFSVAAAKIGSAAVFWRHQPQTLEDFFTLSHQNLLAVIGHLNNPKTFLNSLRGTALAPFKNLAKAIEEAEFTAVPIETHVTENKISIEYRVPLRNHAAGLVIEYNKKNDQITLEGLFLGEARERWGQINTLVAMIQMADGPKLIAPTRMNQQGLEFTCAVKPEQVPLMLEEFKYFTDLTFREDRDIVIAQHSVQILEKLGKTLNYELFRKLIDKKDPVFLLTAEQLLSRIKKQVRDGQLINFGEAFQLIRQAMRSESRDVRLQAIDCFRVLFSKGQGYSEASSAILAGMLSLDISKTLEAFVLMTVMTTSPLFRSNV